MISAELNSLIPRILRPLLGLAEVERTYEHVRHGESDASFCRRLLDHLEITCQVAEEDFTRLPRKGAAVVLSNHPFGILDGAVMCAVLERVRPDVGVLANGVLAAIPELRDRVIAVDPIRGRNAALQNAAGVRAAIAHVESGGMLVVFPAGEVAHATWRSRTVADSQWNASVIRLIEIASKKMSVAIVPAFVAGKNSRLFQTAGLLHPRLRTALLGRELLNKRGTTVGLRFGNPIDSSKMLAIPTVRERCEYLRWRTYLLAARQEFKPRTSSRLASEWADSQEPVIAPVDPSLVEMDVAALDASRKLGQSGELAVYVANAAEIPHVLQEIGRLREITFRAVGEGTGKVADLDRFDHHYMHLFLWNTHKREIAGAYRLCGSEAGIRSLYTATLFDYGDAFLNRAGPALELGRSFVRVEYQKGFTPLLLLWKGIGKFIARNPRYKVLFGPVSISNQYQAISRELMVSFLERAASLRDWAEFLTSRNPFRRPRQVYPFPPAGFDVDDLSDTVADIEPNGAGVPVLLRQYLRLGGKLLGFNVDPQFSNALDGLILVDLTKTEPKLLERYLGKSEAAQFLQFHSLTERTPCNTLEHSSSRAGLSAASRP